MNFVVKSPRSAAGLLSLIVIPIVLPGSSEASSYDNRPKILLHAQNTTVANACTNVNISDCQDAVTAVGVGGAGGGQYIYLLAERGELADIASFEFGISYQENCTANVGDLEGLDIFSWNSCADVQHQSVSPPWPSPYSGIILIWDYISNCQTGDLTVGGYFYCSAYSNDILQVIKRPDREQIEIYDCEIRGFDLDQADLGLVAFSAGAGATGCNPCEGPCPGPLIAPPPPACIAPPPPPPPPPPGPLTEPAILLHLTAVTTKNACAFGALASCSTAVVKGGLTTPGNGPYYFAHVVVNRGELPDLAGLQFGISYDGNLPDGGSNTSRIDIFSWTLCATAEYPMPSPAWPNPGGGSIVVWDAVLACQTGLTAVAGYFYLGAYSADILRLTPRPVDGMALVAPCDATEIAVPEDKLGYAAFSQSAVTPGCNPCLASCAEPVPVRQTTWSGVKTLFH